MSENGDFTYELLDDGSRLQVLESRLRQYELEHYSHALNRGALELASDVAEEDKRAQLEAIDRTLASLEASIRQHRAEREKLMPAGAPPPTTSG